MGFKEDLTFDERKAKSAQLKSGHPNYTPVIIEQARFSRLKSIDRNKYLVKNDVSWSELLYTVRKRLQLSAQQTLFLFVGGHPVVLTSLVALTPPEEDGFIYCKYGEESVFGGDSKN